MRKGAGVRRSEGRQAVKLTHENYDQLSVFTLKGDFAGEESADAFRTEAQGRLDERIRDVVLDMTDVEGIDSQALESLLWLQDACAEKLGQVRLAALRESVAEVLRLTRLASRFDCHEDVDTAIQSLR